MSTNASNVQVIHQVVIIVAQFVFVQFFAEIVLDLVFISLKGGYDIRYFRLIDTQCDIKAARSSIGIGSELDDLGIICLDQFADLGKSEAHLVHFKDDDTSQIVDAGHTTQ